MSYILDALKKSEQERERGNVPDIKTIHTPPTAAAPQHAFSWLYIIVISMLLAAGIVYIWQHYLQPPPQMAEENAQLARTTPQALPATRVAPAPVDVREKPAPVKAPPAAKATAKPKPKETKPSVPPKSNVVFLDQEIPDDQLYSTQPYQAEDDAGGKASAAKTTTGEVKSSAAAKQKAAVQQAPDIVDITGLPLDLRKRLPEITFSGHVYSSVPARRSVIINGKQMREGEFVNAELKLEKITSRGAVFSLAGTWFRLGAMQDWSNR